jgi:cysteine desulfuration protein SufE
MSDTQYPEALQEIIDTFSEASADERLEMLLEYAMSLPDLPEELQAARDTMEQVHECQSPVFLLAKMRDGKVYYYLDVPREAPTVRGFAAILYEGLNGAPPEAITAIPLSLYQQLGLHQAISPLRLRGLTALLQRMKRNAQELASAA